MSAEEALAPTRRHQHTLPDGRVAYEWSQSLSDVTVFVPCPQGVRGRDLDVCIERERCRLGLRGNPPYLDVSAAFYSSRDVLYLSFSLSLSRRRRRPGRGTDRDGERGSETFFFCFFVAFLRSTTRDRKKTKNGKFAHALSNLLSPLHAHNRSTRPSASSRLQSRSGRLVREPGPIG